MSIRRIRTPVVLVVTCLVLALVMSSSVSAATYRVRARGVRFRPAALSVPVGSRVVWRIIDGTHTVTATSNNWNKSTGLLGAGSRTKFRFERRGTYRYRCTVHSTLSDGNCNGMCGRVVVG